MEFGLVERGDAWKHAGGRGGLNPGQAPEAIESAIDALRELFHLGSLAPRAADLKRQDVARIEARRHSTDLLKTPEQEPCSDQQRDGESHLQSD